MDTTFSTTFLHAITFLLSPLSQHYAPQVIDALHISLLSGMSHLDISTPKNILLSPTAPPHPVIVHALKALNNFPVQQRVHWQDWMMLLGQGNQLMLTIVSGLVQVTVRNMHSGAVSQSIIWSVALQTRSASPWGVSTRSRSSAGSSESSTGSESSRASSPVVVDDVAVQTAESALLDDEDFTFLPGREFGLPSLSPSRKLSAAAPEWVPSPALGSRFNNVKPAMRAVSPSFQPGPVSRLAPVGSNRTGYQTHSRSSSRSSTMSAAPSLMSSYSASTATTASLTSTLAALSLSSAKNVPSPAVASHSTGSSVAHSVSSSAASPVVTTPDSPTLSDTSEDAPCYIDQSKDQQSVTVYECGKVGVLTGAVLLGVPRGPKPVKTHGSGRRY